MIPNPKSERNLQQHNTNGIYRTCTEEIYSYCPLQVTVEHPTESQWTVEKHSPSPATLTLEP